jgi:ABC-type uncharacterized transport system auxiliary subunit
MKKILQILVLLTAVLLIASCAIKQQKNSQMDIPLLTMAESHEIESQIMLNWSRPSLLDKSDSNKMVVRLKISLSSDGEITNIEKIDIVRYNSDPVFRAMVDSAERAVRKSSTLKKYAVRDGWRGIELNFDPSQMMY